MSIKTNRVKISKEYLDRFSTDRGGWTRYQLHAIGLEWPPENDWQERVAGMELSKRQQKEFERGRLIPAALYNQESHNLEMCQPLASEVKKLNKAAEAERAARLKEKERLDTAKKLRAKRQRQARQAETEDERRERIAKKEAAREMRLARERRNDALWKAKDAAQKAARDVERAENANEVKELMADYQRSKGKEPKKPDNIIDTTLLSAIAMGLQLISEKEWTLDAATAKASENTGYQSKSVIEREITKRLPEDYFDTVLSGRGVPRQSYIDEREQHGHIKSILSE